MGRKMAHTCEFFNVRTAWHGPNNVDPVGHCYNLHLDLVTLNFGIQEETVFSDKTQEVLPGCPIIKKGYMYSNDKPGLGIDIDEVAAAKYPYRVDFESRETIGCSTGQSCDRSWTDLRARQFGLSPSRRCAWLYALL